LGKTEENSVLSKGKKNKIEDFSLSDQQIDEEAKHKPRSH
jgi:hypothetical protein